MLIAAEVMKDQNWKDKQALERYTLIAQLLDEGIDLAKRSRLRKRLLRKRISQGGRSTTMRQPTMKRASRS